MSGGIIGWCVQQLAWRRVSQDGRRSSASSLSSVFQALAALEYYSAAEIEEGTHWYEHIWGLNWVLAPVALVHDTTSEIFSLYCFVKKWMMFPLLCTVCILFPLAVVGTVGMALHQLKHEQKVMQMLSQCDTVSERPGKGIGDIIELLNR